MDVHVLPERPAFTGWGPGNSPPPPEIDTGPLVDRAISSYHQSEISTFLAQTGGKISKDMKGSGENTAVDNERTYHTFKEGKYVLPNDKQEQERLDFQHKGLQITLGGNFYFAPLHSSPKNVLDVGTGTGIWAIEFANSFPTANVVGSDLSAIQPDNVPPNCRFQVADAEDPWDFPEKFDLIHGRALLSCFEDPTVILQEALKSLAPGGYLEMHDGTFPLKFVGETPVNSAIYKWSKIIMAGGEKVGRPWTNAQHYKRWMEEIGFEAMEERRFYLLTSPWAKGEYYKEVGSYYGANLQVGLEALSLKLMGLLGWSVEDAKAFLQTVRKELEENNIYSYLPVNVVYGRKPLDVPKSTSQQVLLERAKDSDSTVALKRDQTIEM